MGKLKHKGVKKKAKLKYAAKEYKNKTPMNKRRKGAMAIVRKKEDKVKKRAAESPATESGGDGGVVPITPEAGAASFPSTASGPKRQKINKQVLTVLSKMYRPKEPILILGEGNLSYAKALIQGPLGGDGSQVVATNFDHEDILQKKYPDYKENAKELEEKLDATVLCGVDAGRICDVAEFDHAFTRIIWNFPHTGSGEKDRERNIADHQELLSRFFSVAAGCLKQMKFAEVHVTLKEGDPYKSWKIVKVAGLVAPQLRLKNALPFLPEAWPGYEHRRTQGFDERFSARDSEEVRSGAKTYVFGWTKEAVESFMD